MERNKKTKHVENQWYSRGTKVTKQKQWYINNEITAVIIYIPRRNIYEKKKNRTIKRKQIVDLYREQLRIQ